jgi:ribosomal-protein-alanine N-acetyltransferase
MNNLLENNGYSYFIDTNYLLKKEIVDFITENMTWKKELLLKKIEEDIIFFILTLYNGKIVGIAGIHDMLDKGDLKTGITGFVCVDKNHRNKGIGKTIIDLLIKQSSNFKINFLMCIIKSSNTPSIKMFESCGFKFIKHMKWGENLIENIYYYTTLPTQKLKGVNIPVVSVAGYNLTTLNL